jgi:hypothetical protein
MSSSTGEVVVVVVVVSEVEDGRSEEGVSRVRM